MVIEMFIRSLWQRDPEESYGFGWVKMMDMGSKEGRVWDSTGFVMGKVRVFKLIWFQFMLQ